eukprot:342091-Rhodomonas_salina.1
MAEPQTSPTGIFDVNAHVLDPPPPPPDENQLQPFRKVDNMHGAVPNDPVLPPLASIAALIYHGSGIPPMTGVITGVQRPRSHEEDTSAASSTDGSPSLVPEDGQPVRKRHRTGSPMVQLTESEKAQAANELRWSRRSAQQIKKEKSQIMASQKVRETVGRNLCWLDKICQVPGTGVW